MAKEDYNKNNVNNSYENQEENTFDTWEPKTELGQKVKSGEITSLDSISLQGFKVMETEIIDKLLPGLDSDVLLIGQAKGKFGGGKRRAFKQTQKKTEEGNKLSFATIAIVGDHNGHVGIGEGKGSETLPAREKALRSAKLNLLSLRTGCGSWACNCKGHHSIPFAVSGKCGSVTLTLMPAPKGTGLKVEREIAKILDLAGVKDVWSKVSGKASTTKNLIKAGSIALKKLQLYKIQQNHIEGLGIVQGSIKENLE